LGKQYKMQPSPVARIQMPHLYVCGTAMAKSKIFLRQIQQATPCVAWLPAPQDAATAAASGNWYQTVSSMLQQYGKAVIAIEETQATRHVSAWAWRNAMANAVKQILGTNPVHEIFIEGGSTAAAILNALNIDHFKVVNEWQRGVVRLQAKNWLITVKPGSYALPESLKQLYNSGYKSNTVSTHH
jgi:D-threonate/D-erythronate kinase